MSSRDHYKDRLLAELKAGKQDGIALEFEGSYSPHSAAFASDGKCFAVVHSRLEPALDADGIQKPNVQLIRCKCLTLFDTDKRSIISRIVSDELADCYAVSVVSGGQWIATGHNGGVVRIWNCHDQKQVHKLQVSSSGYTYPRFSPDGKLLAVLVQASTADKRRRADTPSGFEVIEVTSGVQSEVVFFETQTFSPTKRWQFADGVFYTWHANRPPAALNPERIAFSPDGTQLLIGAGGATLVEVATGKIVRQFDVK